MLAEVQSGGHSLICKPDRYLNKPITLPMHIFISHLEIDFLQTLRKKRM